MSDDNTLENAPDGGDTAMPETDSEKVITAIEKMGERMEAAGKSKQPSWLAIAAIIITLLLYAVTTGRWSGTSDKTQESQKELTDLKIKFTEDRLEQVRKEMERFEAEKAAQIKQLIDDVSLLKTRADSTDRRLSNGGIK